ncbi:hypothetical protein [Melittangium boletus]|uniref:Uncharacterized protein n=1 Tax=Melittangium boletus DSM 14713 TaxID=1294270 RepID=A0A250IIE6_9BACT|nr:hypothetical protein [Melittangium boletus]ATB30927.1 hypothetical protein MEBOL_004389 [Melittangium boletus DSM 14713]
MNRFLGPASLGVSLLALGVALWGPSGEPAVQSPPPSPPAQAAVSPELEDLVDELEGRIKMLEDNALSLSRRMMLLEQRPGGAAGGAAAPAALASEVEQLRAEVRGLSTGQTLHSEGGRQYFKEMLVSVQDEMRTEQREQRQQRVLQDQTQLQAQRTERLRRFASDARLSSSQERDVTRRLDDENAKRQALFDSMQAGDKSFRDVRQEMRQLREQTDTEVKALLDESQRTQYDEMRREEWQRGRPREWQQGQGQGQQGGRRSRGG